MTTSSSIKSHCEELISSSSNDDSLHKTVIKLNNILKLNEKFQKEIFINLSDKGLSKLMLLMKSDSLETRKASVKLLIELIYNNEVLQNIFCEKFNFNPIGNVICLNWFPKTLKENLTFDASIINDIKTSKSQSKNKFWMWPQNNKYSDELFPDPQKYLIGFYYSNKAAYVLANQSQAENSQFSEIIKNLIIKLESEEESEEINKGNLSKNKTEQAAGSGSESSTKIREKKTDSETSDKFLKTEPIFEEKKKKADGNVNVIKINNISNVNKTTKVSNYINHNVASKPNQRNVSPFSNNQQVIFNIKTKIDKKAFLNTSDIPINRNEAPSYKNEKITSSKNKHNYSKSIETRDMNDNHLQTSHNKTNNKSPLPNFK